MSFLSPWSALLAASIALPLLLLLYFLKLRRRRQAISSTLLWSKSIQDLEVNAPFQRLRWSLLLVLQLLLLLALLTALAQPILENAGGPPARLIIIIDRSASMSTIGGDGRTRLDRAKIEAKTIIRRRNRAATEPQTMLIALGSTAELVSGFDARGSALEQMVDAIGPTDEEANLAAALKLARALTTHDEPAAAEKESTPSIVLISDGGVGATEAMAGSSLPAGEFSFIAIGDEPQDEAGNVGIVSFSARRDEEEPDRIRLFTRLLSTAPDPVMLALTLRVEDAVVDTRMIDLPATGGGLPGEAVAAFELSLPGGGALTLSHSRRDALSTDDAASLIMPPPGVLRVGLVHPDDDPAGEAERRAAGADPFLADLLAAMPRTRLITIPWSTYAAFDPQQIDAGVLFDLVVFDHVRGHALPGIHSLTVGGVPLGVGERPPREPGGRRILSWDREHPVMRHVALDTIIHAGFGAFDLPAGAHSLASGPDGPIMAAIEAAGARHVLVGFGIVDSNWATHVSIAVFMQNALEFLRPAGLQPDGIVYRPGEIMAVRAQPDAQRVSIIGPVEASVPSSPSSMLTLPSLRRAGLYRLEGVAAPMDRLALSVLSDLESDNRPRRTLDLPAGPAAAVGVGRIAPLELWPWLVAAGMGLLILEWLVYLVRRRG